MKTKVLKLMALGAMMLVPVGGAAFDAVTLNFGTEATVSTVKNWTFDALETGTGLNSNTEVNGGYIRANASNTYSVAALGSAQTITFADGYTTTVNKVVTFANKWAGYDKSISSANGTSSQISCFALNVECTGRLYIAVSNATQAKNVRVGIITDAATSVGLTQATTYGEITYQTIDVTEKAVVVFGNLSVDNYSIYAVRFVPTPSVSTATTWTFNDYSTTPTVTSVQPHQDGTGLWVRGASKNNKHFTFAAADKTLTFSDGYEVTVSKSASNAAGLENPETGTAGTASKGTPTFGFDATVPGTIYVKVAATTNCRIYFGNDVANTAAATVTYTTTGADGDYEMSYTSSSAGTFFVGSTSASSTFYAIRFVPTPTVTSKWNFEQYYAVASNVFGTSGSSAINHDGLYVHNNQGHTWFTRHQNIYNTLHNNSATSGAGSLTLLSGKTASAVVNVDAIAYDAPCAGTFTFNIYANNTTESMYVYKDGTLDATKSVTTTGYQAVTYSCSSAATLYFVPSGNNFDFISASFVPTTAGASQYKYVTIGAAGKATFCAAQNYTIPSGLTAYYVSAVDTENKTATMTQITSGVIPACTGVILYGDEGTYEMVSSESADAIGTNYLVANLADYALPASGTYNNTTQYTYTLASDGFIHSDGTGTLAAGKAFLRTTLNVTDPGAPGLTLVFDNGETTGISATLNNNEEIKNSTLYNLSGQRVGCGYKGLVIRNGKKYVVK